MRRPIRIPALLAVVALVGAVAGCGGPDAPPSTPKQQPAPPAAPAAVPAATDGCGAAPSTKSGGTPVTDLVAARASIDRASRARTASGSRFTIRGTANVTGLPSARARITGTRTAANASAASLRWEGTARALLPDARLRIVRDTIGVRVAGTDWRDLGSASGVSIDVGRELLEHPFLLEARSARRIDGALEVTLVAPTAALRDYATSERRGPVTDLLRGTRSLRLIARVDSSGALTGDRFTLATVLPASISERLAGRAVTLRGSTTSCALTPR